MTLDVAREGLSVEHVDAEPRDEATLSLNSKIEDLKQALETRSLIGQAIGLTMARYRLDTNAALAFLVRESQKRNIKLREISRDLVREAERLAEIG